MNDDDAIAVDTAARREVAARLAKDAQVMLHHAHDSGSALMARKWTSEAADLLHCAGFLTVSSFDEHGVTLMELSLGLRQACEAAVGHPSGQVLDAVCDAADEIIDELEKGRG